MHPSTAACLEMLQWLHARQDCAQILDMGCGSGILAAASASIWEAKVVAADIAEKAVADAKAMIAEHGLENAIEIVRSDGFSHPLIHRRAPYDLIIGNLLADVLLGMAHDIENALRPGGHLLCSGILSWRAGDIERVFTGLGFEIAHKITSSPWECYLFLKPS